jgi:hypothetical protein
MTGASRTIETKDRCPGKGSDKVESGDLNDKGDLDGKEGGEAAVAEEDDGDEHGAAAADDEDEVSGLVSVTGWIDTSKGERALADQVLAHNDLKRRARWPRP